MKKNFLLKQFTSILVTGAIVTAYTQVFAEPVQSYGSNSLIEGIALNAEDVIYSSYNQENNLPEEIPTRQSILEQVKEFNSKLAKDTENLSEELAYAKRLFQLGDFTESKKIVTSILKKEKSIDEAIYLSAQLEYLMGNYKEAEKLYNKLDKNTSKDYKIKAQTGLLYTYYQTNQFNKAKNLTTNLEKQRNEPLKEMMIGFGNKKPYELSWNGRSEVKIPFVANEPLPVISMIINGKKINAIIDTGASEFYLDMETAKKLNINIISKNIGKYAGGIEVETGTGIANSLDLNGITMKNVPVIIAPIKQFSSLYDEMEINGIVSTGMLKQFLATMDYPNNQLILRPRNKQGKAILEKYLSQYNMMNEIDFTLANSHFMMAKGTINGQDSLNFFLDSGLADEKAQLILLEQTMKFLNISKPKMERGSQDAVGGLGGNDFEVGEFNINEFTLGNLPIEKNIWTLFGVLEASFNYEESNGFIIDGLISHNFFKKYSWTIDFDTMKMIFAY